MGLGDGGLASLDPRDRSCQLLASRSITEWRSDLDGGSRYEVNAILPDAERKCLWLGIEGGSVRGRGKREGLWRYDPATGKADYVRREPPTHGISALAWRNGRIVCTVGIKIISIDPDTLSATWLAGKYAPTGCKDQKPLYGNPGMPLRWVVFDGDHLITVGERSLVLHRQGKTPATLTRLPKCGYFHPRALSRCADGVLLINGTRDPYLLRRRDDEAKAETGGTRATPSAEPTAK